MIGIGNSKAAESFCSFTGLSLDSLRCDPDGAVHEELNLHQGLRWKVPNSVSDDSLKFLLNSLPGGAPKNPDILRSTGDAWLNYLLMCAGIGAPGTLAEIFRGYVGDTSSPERLGEEEIVTAGPIQIGPGVGPVKIGK